MRRGVTMGESMLGVFSDGIKADVSSGAGLLGRVVPSEVESCALRGDFNGERNGFDSVLVATSILRRLTAGVDIFRSR